MLEHLRRTLRMPVSFPARRLDDTAGRLAAAFVSGEHCLLFRQVPFDFRPMRHGTGKWTDGGMLALEFIATLVSPSLSAQAGLRVARHAAAEIGALLADPRWLGLEHDFALSLAARLHDMPPLAPLPQIGINIVPNGWNDGILVHKTSFWHRGDTLPATQLCCPAMTMDLWMELKLERSPPMLYDAGEPERHFVLRARLRGLQADSTIAPVSAVLLPTTVGPLAPLARLADETRGWLAERLRLRGVHAGLTTPGRFTALLATRPERMPNPGAVPGGHHVVLPLCPEGGVLARQYGAPDNGSMRLTAHGERVTRSDTAQRATLLMSEMESRGYRSPPSPSLSP